MAQEEHEMKSIGLNTDTMSISQTEFLGGGWGEGGAGGRSEDPTTAQNQQPQP